MANTKREMGDKGEVIAAEYLKRKGYVIIDTNWHCTYGELDIIARQENTLVFVEVKTTRSTTSEYAFANITTKKRERLIASAHTYLDEQGLRDALWRIDAIAIMLRHGMAPQIEHVEDALGW